MRLLRFFMAGFSSLSSLGRFGTGASSGSPGNSASCSSRACDDCHGLLWTSYQKTSPDSILYILMTPDHHQQAATKHAMSFVVVDTYKSRALIHLYMV